MFTAATTKTVSQIARASLFGMLLAGPMLAMPALSQDRSLEIEAPAPKKTGAGFVLMVSLQRR
jgi:hypothetical protein